MFCGRRSIRSDRRVFHTRSGKPEVEGVLTFTENTTTNQCFWALYPEKRLRTASTMAKVYRRKMVRRDKPGYLLELNDVKTNLGH